MMRNLTLLGFWALTTAAFPAPQPTPAPDPGVVASILSGGGLADLAKSLVAGIKTDTNDFRQVESAYAALLTDATLSHKPTAPTNIAEARAVASQVVTRNKENDGSILEEGLAFILGGLSPAENAVLVATEGLNFASGNAVLPAGRKIYPRKGKKDAPFSLTEEQLRSAIFIPPGFTYGKKQPVLLSPGTGATGASTFAGNMFPLLVDSEFADPVLLNMPGYLLGNIQNYAEFVAYAINYISSISQNKKVGVVTWSQGSLDFQWAVKYWPSARETVSDLIAVSPDFHGTVNAYFLCPGFPKLQCDPAVLQQEYDSNFVKALLADDGDSAYVPTTTVYSSFFDEIVEPQTGVGASGYIHDARGVGASNTDVQSVCAGKIAGTFYDHAGVLFHPLAHALVRDALTHSGPGSIDRLDLDYLCSLEAAPGLTVTDVLATEATIPQALVNLLAYKPKSTSEPTLRSYAQ